MRFKRYLWILMYEGYVKTINKKVNSRDKNRMYKMDNASFKLQTYLHSTVQLEIQQTKIVF